MANLKYYDVEREMFGADLRGTILIQDISKEIRRICRHFHVPTIQHELWRGRYSFYDRDGRFIRFAYCDTRNWGSGYIFVSSLLHEIAHYLDDCQRSKEIEAVFRNDTRNYVRRSATIRQAKWHGPRHRAQMVALVKWWLD